MFATSISEPEAPDAADIRSWHVTPIPGLDDLYEEARMYEVVEYLQGASSLTYQKLGKAVGCQRTSLKPPIGLRGATPN